MDNIANIRRDYNKFELSIDQLAADPIKQFEFWLQDALNTHIKEPTAMTLSTVSAKGKPSARVVLLKGIEAGYFLFYSNYKSQKGSDIQENPQVCLSFFWDELQRQVRISGRAVKVAADVSNTYFNSRPKGSRLGVYASKQSSILQARKTLEERYEIFERKYADTDFIPRPNYWGGYMVKPTEIEFWQGRTNRLHDRIIYILNQSKWKKMRLAP